MRGFRLGIAHVSLWLGALVATSCSCGEDELDPSEACDEVTAAVNVVLSTCGQSTFDRSRVCGAVCGGGFAHCSERADVEACATAISSLSCTQATGGEYQNLGACAAVFENMSASCSGGGDGDGDDDD